MNHDDRDVLPVNPTLRVRTPLSPSDDRPAAQGPAPADLADREAPPVPTPAREHLSAEEVEALVGPDTGAGDTDRPLQLAGNLNPDMED
ncbi:hypothetical protein F8S09_01795 [Deinococcus sp. SDU3-2]|uniref:Uncharacterized protein n=1 Tax=Deinococcus terrestris TaxID=2651870 RepID=A0A7X1TQH2_9DEIO|nr:hypothetical protein [Deinococcus terrestris]MPY65426.1 hypothetical protein [Deinococcus terrestris]